MGLRLLTAGESHGKTLVGVLEGLPAGLSVTPGFVQTQLARRRHGHGRSPRQRLEEDKAEIVAGLRAGRTIGSPISVLIPNRDHSAWSGAPVHVPRPGHADLAGAIKYGRSDLRDVMERASARETAIRVALGCFARRMLEELDMRIASRVVSIGTAVEKKTPGVPFSRWTREADASPVRCLDPLADKRMVAAIDKARKRGETLGGIFEVIVSNPPVGLGSYAHFDRRLDGRIAGALMSLNAVKGVEIGPAFGAAGRFGSEVLDEYFPGRGPGGASQRTNYSGGLDGGMTTGQPIQIRAAMKPLPTLSQPLRSVDLRTGKRAKAHVLRGDVCAVPAASVIAESILALVLADAVLEKFGGDSMPELLSRVRSWRRANLLGRRA